MQNILSFLTYKQEKEDQQMEQLFKKAHSFDERLDVLVGNRQLQVEDHKLFLAFLAYLELQQMEPERIFRDVITLPRHTFEAQYRMNWAQVVKLACTFLVILKDHNREAYDAFTAT